MRVTWIGTGAAGGIPLYGCHCAACELALIHPTSRRQPCSALIEAGNTKILLDAGLTDLTERFPPSSLSAILLTHFHPDHVQGLFHLRWGVGKKIVVYAPSDSEGCADLYKHPGLLEFRHLAKFKSFHIDGLTITPLPLIHSKPTFGYALEDASGARIAYLTDTAGLPPKTETFLRDWQASVLVLDCMHPPLPVPSTNHNDLTRALTTIEAVAPGETWLTHIGHEFDAWLIDNEKSLPPSVSIARDGEVIEVSKGGRGR